MPSDAVAEIKARLDVVDVVGSYVRLQRSGRSHKGLCPFHSERTPSFHVDQQRQAWYCFGCSEGGDVFTFIERIERVDFRQALQLLAERAGVELEERGGERHDSGRRRRRALELNRVAQSFFEYVLWSTPVGAPGRALLVERGVSEELGRLFGVGFAPAGGVRGDALLEYLVKRGHASAQEVADAGLAHPAQRGPARDRFRHRVVFPIRDERGAVLGFGGRALGDAIPKYLNTPATDAYEKSTALFGIDLAKPAIAEARQAVLVEGYFDVVAARAAGVRHAVASSGTALTAAQVRLLARHTRTVVLCFDNDDAGQAAARKAVEVVAAEGVEARICVLPPGVKDPDELVRSDPAAFVACVAGAAREWQVLLDRALAGAEGGSVDERRAGVERTVALLCHIPEATTRELYVQQAARRLELNPKAMSVDVERAASGAARGGPTRLVVAVPAAPDAVMPPRGVVEGDGRPPARVPAWERDIGSLVIQRPELAKELVEAHGLDPDELTVPAIRRLVDAARASPAVPLALHLLAPDDRGLAARLLLRALPELGDLGEPDLLRRFMEDCTWRTRQAALDAQVQTVERERRVARDGGRAAEAEELALRLHTLGVERERHRSRATSASAS